MSKILITGGLGYIGYELVSVLLEKEDHEIIIYDNLYRNNLGLLFTSLAKNKKITFVEGDILDNRTLGKAAQNVDSIVHLAAKVSTPFAQGDFFMFDYVNNWGTANVVNAAMSNEVKEFIYLSTLSIYGHSENVMNEASPIIPITDYAKSKYEGEKHVHTLPDSCKKIIARSGNAFGYNPSLRLDAVLNNFVYKAKFGQKLIVNGNGEQNRAFIHVSRLANQIHQLILNDSVTELSPLLCDISVSVNELIEIIKSINPKVEYNYVNPERGMNNQKFHGSSLDGFNPLAIDQFKKQIIDFYSTFQIK